MRPIPASTDRNSAFTRALWGLVLALPLLAGCYPRLTPMGPVVASEIEALGAPLSSETDYGEWTAENDMPVLPFLLWGLDFDEEVLFEFANHPRWGMVEVARVARREGGWAWFGLLAERSGTQHVVVGSAADASLAAAFPAPLHDGRLRVIRLEGKNAVEYNAAMTLPTGELLQARLVAPKTGKTPPLRNGNSMNHSQDRVLAVLDLEEFSWARPQVLLDGKPAKVRQLAPFVPFAWRLEQAAGGVSAGEVRLSSPAPGQLMASVGEEGAQVPFAARVSSDAHGPLVDWTGHDPVVDLHYRFRPLRGTDCMGPCELVEAEVRHGEVSAFRVRFNPALPDLRAPRSEVFEGRMVAGSNGQEGLMIGTVRVRPGPDGGTRVELVPDRPFWACERPVATEILRVEGAVLLSAQVERGLALDGQGAEHCFSQR